MGRPVKGRPVSRQVNSVLEFLNSEIRGAVEGRKNDLHRPSSGGPDRTRPTPTGQHGAAIDLGAIGIQDHDRGRAPGPGGGMIDRRAGRGIVPGVAAGDGDVVGAGDLELKGVGVVDDLRFERSQGILVVAAGTGEQCANQQQENQDWGFPHNNPPLGQETGPQWRLILPFGPDSTRPSGYHTRIDQVKTRLRLSFSFLFGHIAK